MKKMWYVVYTKNNYEKKTEVFFKKNDIDSYCPMNRIISEDMKDKKHLLYEPLFKSYVFVCLSDNQLAIIKDCNSIINFVYYLGRPVTVNEFEIQNIKHFTMTYFNIRLEKTLVRLNRISRIVNRVSDYYGYDSNNENLNDHKISIVISSLGYILKAEYNLKNTNEIKQSKLMNT